MVVGDLDKDINFPCEIKSKAWHAELLCDSMSETTALEKKFQSSTKELRACSHDPAPFPWAGVITKQPVCCLHIVLEMFFCNLAINQKANWFFSSALL